MADTPPLSDADIPSFETRRSPFLARMVASAIIFLAGIAVTLHLWIGYDHEIYHVRLLTSSMTDAVSLQIGGSFRGIEGLLEDVAMAVRSNQWTNPAVRQRISGRMMTFPELRWVGYVTPDGILTTDTQPAINIPEGGLDVSDRDYVRRAECSPRPKLRVGQPVVGRATGERTIHLAFPIATTPNGDCRGMVVAAVNPDHLAQILENVLLDPEGSSAVITLDGAFVARAPDHAGKFGQSLISSPLFTEFLPKSPSGVAYLRAQTDNNKKFLGYKTLPEYGLVVTSGLSVSKALSSWYALAAVEIPGFLIFSLSLFLWSRSADQRSITMMRHQAGLEAAVAERTAMLAAAKSLAEERAARLSRVNDKLTHLARITAHHLQEPVRPIVSFSQLARREINSQLKSPDSASPELENHLRFVEDAGRRLKSILKEFHRYTALLVKEPNFAPCDLSLVAGRSLAHLSRAAAEASARVEIGPMPKVIADGALIEQVLKELISNGIKYRHPDRTPYVSVAGGLERPELEGDSPWWISVTDNGRGLPNVGRHHLFEAFSRINPDSPEAIGLGLAVCREVIEMHGGTIDAVSQDSGTVFTIRVPGNAARNLVA